LSHCTGRQRLELWQQWDDKFPTTPLFSGNLQRLALL
jgi:hypothetical protein